MISIATKGMFVASVKVSGGGGLSGVMPAIPQLAKPFDVKISEVSEIDSEQKIDVKVTTLVEGDY
jgi:hypothetical protein